MKFHVLNARDPNPRLRKPACALVKDSWDDFGNRVLFHLSYFSAAREWHRIGSIRIQERNSAQTRLPATFTQLSNKFISLGRNIELYKTLLMVAGYAVASEILLCLNDIAWRPLLATPFEPTPGFRNALMRDNSGQLARRFGRAVLEGRDVTREFGFTYTLKLPGTTDVLSANVDFNQADDVPGRIVALIGRNATGKSQFLAQLASDLVQLAPRSQTSISAIDSKFFPERPVFNRIIAVSYSAFDRFSRPRSSHASYVYCGFRESKRSGLSTTLDENLQRIKELRRLNEWDSCIKRVLGRTLDRRALLRQFKGSSEGPFKGPGLSSGEAILCSFVTALLAWIDSGSLVLFDEPETHLHPNAVAIAVNVLSTILEKYESFSIVATHSPIVIQEVPAKRVLLFERVGGSTTATKLDIECFGENISVLTRRVFDTESAPAHYKHVLKELAARMSLEEVRSLFDNRLGMHAESYLSTLY